ncbi:Hypothetical protein POVR1_LOCUS13 [uncultured virus]|nr:Hypothetical protein POVR1_LOCUS13 [uncultured virus]
MHSHGFVYGDVRRGNIIFGLQSQRYQLIDFGRTFSVTDSEKYPPMQYMMEEEGELPTQAEDLRRLEIL